VKPYAIRTIAVEKYKSGSRQGEWRSFSLPDDAVILRAWTTWIGEYPTMHIDYAVPASLA
jgi:hypothetical protein